jgi:ferrous iron transport protein A
MKVIPLSSLKEGERGTVTEMEQSAIAFQLSEMGIMPGIEIKVYKIAPLGDPMIISVNDSELTLRKSEAAVVLVEVT